MCTRILAHLIIHTPQPSTKAEGFVLNEQNVKMRGFCNHESFAGVGMAVSDRINLFRLQSMRGLGGNAVRASHNPPNPVSKQKYAPTGILHFGNLRTLTESSHSPPIPPSNQSSRVGLKLTLSFILTQFAHLFRRRECTTRIEGNVELGRPASDSSLSSRLCSVNSKET